LYVIGTVNVDETTHAFSPKVLDRAFTLELTEADFSGYPPANGSRGPALDQSQREILLGDFTRQGRYAQIEKGVVSDYAVQHPYLKQYLQMLNQLLRPFDFHFGYRVFDEIAAFLANSDSNQLYKDITPVADPLDAAVLMKVLPKFHGSRGLLEEPLRIVLAWCKNPAAPDQGQLDQLISNNESNLGSLIKVLESQEYRLPNTAKRIIRMMRSLYSTGFAAFG
jgi:5-methylcytosine-specific restriction endonuclease McrBC GTP-binding regulatory subunit McrB